MAINRRRRRSVKGHSVLSTSLQNVLYVLTYMRANFKSAVVYSSYLCAQRFLPNNYLAKGGGGGSALTNVTVTMLSED